MTRMQTLRFLMACALILAGMTTPLAANPIMPGADPHVVALEGKFWLYPTRRKGGENFYAYESSNLKDWKEHGPVLNFSGIEWIKADGRKSHGPWAPCLAVRNGKFYFYFSVGPQTPEHPSRIGVAVADSPTGPFVDSGRALVTGGDGFEAIDPMVFEDPASGLFYLYAGGSAGATLRIYELKEDMMGLAREVPTQTPEKFTEGAFMHHHGGLYHLTYSHGNFRDASYSVHYSTAARPYGPWVYRGVLLQSDERHKGPGHHSIFTDADGVWHIAYHRWNNREGSGPYHGPRVIALDKLTYDNDGLLLPVTMTD